MHQHGFSRGAGALPDLYESMTTKLSVYSACPVKLRQHYFTGVFSSEPERREGERVVNNSVCGCLRLSALALWNPACGGFAPVKQALRLTG